MEFEGKVALVTGAGSGIGAATARRLAEAGATVAVLDLLGARAEEVAAGIEAGGGKALALSADIADEAAMEAAFDTLLARTGRLDLLVVNAGINGTWAPIERLAPAEWDRTIRVNLRGAYLTLHFAVPHLKRQGGAVVIVSSINGTRTFTTAGATAYSAAKAGQAAMASQLALELGRDGIRVNTVCPGMTATRISENTERRDTEAARFPVHFPEGEIPLTGGAAATPEDVADAITLLLSPRSRHVTGTRLYVDGGQSLLR